MQVVVASKPVRVGGRRYKAGAEIRTNALFARALERKGLVAGAGYERRDMQAVEPGAFVDVDELTVLRDEYLTKFGKKADARWGVKRLTDELKG